MPPAVEAFRELRDEKDAGIAMLHAENRSLQDQNQELTRRLKRLEGLVEQMAATAGEAEGR